MNRCFVFSSILAACLLAGFASGAQRELAQREYEEDFDYLWQTIADEYAYFDQKQTDWNQVREIYRPRIGEIRKPQDFVAFLESVLEELYDSHTHLNTNTGRSPRLVPSGTDLWGEWIDGKAIITEVRPGSNAERAGVKAGMEILAINGTHPLDAANGRVGRALRSVDDEVRSWALRALLAGRWNEKRDLLVGINGTKKTIAIDDRPPSDGNGDSALLSSRRIDQNLGYVKIHNSLGDIELIRQFDLALDAMKDTRGLILDLRDTPGGGNTTVARGLMGRFITCEMPYQKHSIPAEERRYGTKRSWIELVSPRGATPYTAPVVVLVNHWTGSMGEGIAIGMDGMKRATTVGTTMAGLLGATSGITLPNTGIGVSFPTEKLFHLDGTPRERYEPSVVVDVSANDGTDEDPVLKQGISVLNSMIPPMPSP